MEDLVISSCLLDAVLTPLSASMTFQTLSQGEKKTLRPPLPQNVLSIRRHRHSVG